MSDYDEAPAAEAPASAYHCSHSYQMQQRQLHDRRASLVSLAKKARMQAAINIDRLPRGQVRRSSNRSQSQWG
jgi:hypothetical protein